MPKPKPDPNVNRVGIKVFGRATKKIEAEFFAGLNPAGLPRFRPCNTVTAFRP